MDVGSIKKDIHFKNITSIGYNPLKREILTGFEDGQLKFWEYESLNQTGSVSAHRGWLTDILFWKQGKMMITSGHDSTVAFWQGNTLVDRVYFEHPIFKLEILVRRCQLVMGTNQGISVYKLTTNKNQFHHIERNSRIHINDHSDIVQCVCVRDNRVYSGGFDQNLIMYDCSYSGEMELKFISMVHGAHDAGITAMDASEDSDGNTWVITGGFDKCVKIWSSDIKLIHKFSNCFNSIVSICSIAKNRTVWIGCGSVTSPMIIDAKSGENITNFCTFFDNQENDLFYQTQVIKYCSDLNMVFVGTFRRNLITFRYQNNSSISKLQCDAPLDSISYTRHAPILLFATNEKGLLFYWEQNYSNPFSFKKDYLSIEEASEAAFQEKVIGKKRDDITSNEIKSSGKKSNSKPKDFGFGGKRILKTIFLEDCDQLVCCGENGIIYIFGFDKRAINALKKMKKATEKKEVKKLANSKYDILFKSQDSQDQSENAGTDQPDKNTSQVEQHVDQVTKRVAGIICHHVLINHHNAVTSCVLIRNGKQKYLVTAGWDQRICIWNIDKGLLIDVFRDPQSALWEERELAADDAIIDMAYSEKLNHLAYASADHLVYIRQFSPIGSQMKLINVLRGHEGEINKVIWFEDPQLQIGGGHPADGVLRLDEEAEQSDLDSSASNAAASPSQPGYWMTAGDDGSVRIWNSVGFGECLKVFTVGGPVQTMLVDSDNSVFLVVIGNQIKIFDYIEGSLMLTNNGHTDEIRDVIHIPELNQYASVSLDGYIMVWNAYKKPRAAISAVTKKIEESPESKMRSQSIKSKTNYEESTNLTIADDLLNEKI